MNGKLKEIENENIVIFIYFILLFIYLYANTIEVNYIKYGNNEDKKTYRNLLFLVFSVAFIISLYYTINNYKNLNNTNNNEIYNLNILSLLANILIVIATGIYIYLIYKDENIDLEVSP